MCEGTFKCKLLFCTVGESGVNLLPAWVCVEHGGVRAAPNSSKLHRSYSKSTFECCTAFFGDFLHVLFCLNLLFLHSYR